MLVYGFGLVAALHGTALNAAPTVLFLMGKHEYGTTESLPTFAAEQLTPRGYHAEIVVAAANDRSSPDCHVFPNLESALARADLLVVSTRRRFLTTAQMGALRDWVDQKKPILGIRTASHAFGARSKGEGYVPQGDQVSWNDFDRDVFGAHYQGHSRNSDGQTLIIQPRETRSFPVMQGIRLPDQIPVSASLYYMRQLDDRARILLTGKSADDELSFEPVSWTLEREGWRTFYTSLGDRAHFELPWFNEHLTGAIEWLLEPSTAPSGEPEFLEKEYEAPGEGLAPADSLAGMITPPDLTVDLLKAEPGIQQPAFLNFDERGRMWVVEYRQYPEPAGLELVSRDQYWRNVYDRKPLPPGHPDFTPGLDRISIHEDTNGDGTFDHAKMFVEGLSLATAVVKGNGGAWVLNPPYLLFYPDANEDDVPDAAPSVHLDGFGIQDSHAVVSSLTWGPDGWLYGAQGSTVTSDIVVSGSAAPPESRVGQLMWRYHPTLKTYDVFAEGGGNIWSCEFDAAGRLFAGTNDRYPAYAYLQGAFYRKNFGKHGALSNPHAYDHFQGIDATGHRRVSTSVLVYGGANLPARFDGSLMYLGVLQGKVGAYQLEPQGLNFTGQALDLPLNATDRWFRPVYLESGPDGAVYVADWYDQQVNHYRNHEGAISKADGRLFRIRGSDTAPIGSFDLSELSATELVDVLYYRNQWWRDQARQQLRGRDDAASILPRLHHMLKNEQGQPALEAMWALNLLSPGDERAFATAIQHTNADVRNWAVRLVGDRRFATDAESGSLLKLATIEQDVEVLAQLASSAARLPTSIAWEITRGLIENPASMTTPGLDRMIWWSVEPRYAESPSAFARWFADIAREVPASLTSDLASFAMRRITADGLNNGFGHATELLDATTDSRLMAAFTQGFETALSGRSLKGLPAELVTALNRQDEAPISLRLRFDFGAALPGAMKLLTSPETELATRLRILEAISERRATSTLPAVLSLLDSAEEPLVLATLHGLQAFESDTIATEVTSRMDAWNAHIRDAAETLLVSRAGWSSIWLDQLARSDDPTASISTRALEDMRGLNDDEITHQIDALFGSIDSQTDHSFETEIARVREIVSQPGGVPQDGWKHYQQRCAACHRMFDRGGNVGPDLTPYQRDQLDTLLLSIIHPDAEIREGFEMITIETTDDRVLSGFLSRNESDLIALQMVGGAEVIVPRDQVRAITPQARSLMPAGLLTAMEDQALRDLIAYLQIRQPLDIKP